MMKTIKDEDFVALKQKHGLTLVKIFTEWCGPCKKLEKTLEEILPNFPTVNFVQLNADQNPKTVGELKIRGVPTMVLIKNGTVVDTLVGDYPADRIKSFIQNYQY